MRLYELCEGVRASQAPARPSVPERLQAFRKKEERLLMPLETLSGGERPQTLADALKSGDTEKAVSTAKQLRRAGSVGHSWF